jgi:hypothetical protein
MSAMADTVAKKTQDAEIKLDELGKYIGIILSDRIILKIQLMVIKEILTSNPDVKINDLVRQINTTLERVNHEDVINGRHGKNH